METTSNGFSTQPPAVEEIVLPADLEERTFIQFDEMVRKGRIFYDHQKDPGEVYVDDGFLVSGNPFF